MKGQSLLLKSVMYIVVPFLRCLGAPPCFLAVFAKDNNFCDFLFASLKGEALPERGQLTKGDNLHVYEYRFGSRVIYSFQRATP